MLIFEKPGIIKSTYEEDQKVILFKWYSFSITLDDIKTNHNKGLEVMKEKGCNTIIADTSEVTDAFSEDIIPWFGSEWVPKAVAEGLKLIVTVVPTAAIGTLSTDEWQATEFQGITLQNAKTYEDALEIAKGN